VVSEPSRLLMRLALVAGGNGNVPEIVVGQMKIKMAE
jgi:hypothetical protein